MEEINGSMAKMSKLQIKLNEHYIVSADVTRGSVLSFDFTRFEWQ